MQLISSFIFLLASTLLIDAFKRRELWWYVIIVNMTLIVLKDNRLIIARNIGLDGNNEQNISSYSSIHTALQYAIDDDPTQYCQSTLRSLTVGQKQICLLHADHMPIIAQGKTETIFCLFVYGMGSSIKERAKESTNVNISFKIVIGIVQLFVMEAFLVRSFHMVDDFLFLCLSTASNSLFLS
jgi:hypothetical protein